MRASAPATALGLAAAVLLTGCAGPSREPVQYLDHRTFPVTEGKLVRIEGGFFDPEIQVTAVSEISVEVALSARASTSAAANRWLQRHRPTMEDSPAVLTIRAPRRARKLLVGSLRTRSHLRVMLPPNCQLEVTSSSGDVHLEGSEVLTAPVRITTTSGDVSVRGGASVLEVRTVSGDLKATTSQLEQLHWRSTSGDATVQAPLRSVLADTTSGDLQLEDLVGNFSVHTTSGDVRGEWAHLPAVAAIRVDTTSGDVRLRLPSWAGVSGQLRTSTGSVRTSAPGRWERHDRHYLLVSPAPLNRSEAAPGGSGVTVEVVSRTGDISLRPL